MRNANQETRGYGNMATYGYYVNNNELYHHGIKGQKWGIRRYQNPDGSLTAEGIKRYRMNDTDLTSVASRKAAMRRYKDISETAQKAAIKKANDEKDNFSNKKEKNDYILYQKEEYLNKKYQELFGDKADLNRTRDQSAYLYNKSKNINVLRNVGRNAVAGLSFATLGIGVFGGSKNNSGKVYKEIYKSTTEKLIKDLDNFQTSKTE